MKYEHENIAAVAVTLRERLQHADNPADVLKSVELKALFEEITTLPKEQRASFGKEVNALRQELVQLVENTTASESELSAIDITAPFDVNTSIDDRPILLPTQNGSRHPLMTELDRVLDIFYRMGFTAVESRQLDDDYHMFEALNFPAGHPARDDYDTFMTEEGLIAPAHTSTMQNRILRERSTALEQGEPIAVVIPGRVFRNEDIDATHEHTFHQIEGLYVDKGVHAGMLVATLQVYLSEYFEQELHTKLQPFYFPFTEPSFEFAVERPAFLRKNDSEEQKWLELGGCGMIHPNVLRAAGIDPQVYTGFAWGFGVERMVMMKNDIEDIRHFESGKLDFLRQFK